MKVRKLTQSKSEETLDFHEKFGPEYNPGVDLSRITENSKVRLEYQGKIVILY